MMQAQIHGTTALNVWCHKCVMVFFSGFSPNLPTEVVIDCLLKFSSHHSHVMIEYIVGLSSCLLCKVIDESKGHAIHK